MSTSTNGKDLSMPHDTTAIDRLQMRMSPLSREAEAVCERFLVLREQQRQRLRRARRYQREGQRGSLARVRDEYLAALSHEYALLSAMLALELEVHRVRAEAGEFDNVDHAQQRLGQHRDPLLRLLWPKDATEQTGIEVMPRGRFAVSKVRKAERRGAAGC